MSLYNAEDSENWMVARPPIYRMRQRRVDCPICGQECWYVFVDSSGYAVGCDVCLKQMDVDDYWSENEE